MRDLLRLGITVTELWTQLLATLTRATRDGAEAADLARALAYAAALQAALLDSFDRRHHVELARPGWSPVIFGTAIRQTC